MPDAQRLKNVVTFQWEMVPAGEPDTAAAVGLEVLVLEDDGRVRTDYQFVLR